MSRARRRASPGRAALWVASLCALAMFGCKRDAPAGPSSVSALSYLPTAPTLTADGKKIGVTVHAREAWPGLYVGCAAVHPPEVVFQAASGAVVHRVPLPEVPGRHTGCHVVRPHPSGDLLVLGTRATMRVGMGGELRWLRREWEEPTLEVHHDVSALPGGDVLALVHQVKRMRVPTEPEPVDVFLDAIALLSGQTGEVHEVLVDLNALMMNDAYAGDGYGEPHTDNPRWSRARDPLHSNALTLVTQQAGPLQPGDYLVSMLRGEVIVGLRGVREGRAQVVWRYAREGEGEPAVDPHGPQVTERGTVMYFDNGYGARLSSVIEVDPTTLEVVWRHNPEPKTWVGYCGFVQSLPGGRALIADSTRGRVFEIDREGRLLWEHFSPFADNSHKRRAIPCRAYKVVDPAEWGPVVVRLSKEAGVTGR